jgi:hypothetical protein
MIYSDDNFKTAHKKSRLLFISNYYRFPQLGRFTPLVVQYAFGLCSPEPPLQGFPDGQTCSFFAKTVPTNEEAIIIAAAAARTTIANVTFLVSSCEHSYIKYILTMLYEILAAFYLYLDISIKLRSL